MRLRVAPPRVALLLAIGLFASGCGSDTPTSDTTAPTDGVSPPAERVLFGHVESLTLTDGRYRLRFDPALMLSGEAANLAAAEDGAVEPGQPVPNDNYVVDETHRLYTFPVADDATVRVLTTGTETTTIGVAELARALRGQSKVQMWDPRTTAVWITVDVDTVRTIVQQYHP